MVKYIKLLIGILFVVNLSAQCPNDNTLWNVNATPPCPGSTNVSCIFGGEYVLVNVIAGNTYTFSTCGGATWDTQITLYNNLGGGPLEYNDDGCGLQSTITWTSTFTGQIRVLVDRFNCSNFSSCSNLTIICSGSCIPPPQQDCLGGTQICSNQSFSNNSQGTGCSQDLNINNRGCLTSNERQGTWYYFYPSTSGTLSFTINPTNPNDDYDFAIWGPFNTFTLNNCQNLGQPIRCSYSSQTGPTGLDFTSVDLSEGIGGDKWVRFLDVLIGQMYILYIDNFSQSGLSFNLDFNSQNTSSLNCEPLPIELLNFSGYLSDSGSKLNWITGSEINTSHFNIEHSVNGVNFIKRGEVPASGFSTSPIEYTFIDKYPIIGLNYYRLVSIDLNDEYSISNIIVLEKVLGNFDIYPNPTFGESQVIMNSNFGSKIGIKIYDNIGRVIFESRFIDGNIISFNISDKESGQYHLVLMNENQIIGNTRLIKF